MSKLKNKLIRLAYQKPELRKDLLPILKEAADYTTQIMSALEQNASDAAGLSSKCAENAEQAYRLNFEIRGALSTLVRKVGIMMEMLRKGQLDESWVRGEGRVIIQLLREANENSNKAVSHSGAARNEADRISASAKTIEQLATTLKGMKSASQKTAGWQDALQRYLDDPSPMQRAELSDYGMDMFRDAGRRMGYGKKELIEILTEERDRLRSSRFSPDVRGMQNYWRLAREGSPYAVNRLMRTGIFLHGIVKGWVR